MVLCVLFLSLLLCSFSSGLRCYHQENRDAKLEIKDGCNMCGAVSYYFFDEHQEKFNYTFTHGCDSQTTCTALEQGEADGCHEVFANVPVGGKQVKGGTSTCCCKENLCNGKWVSPGVEIPTVECEGEDGPVRCKAGEMCVIIQHGEHWFKQCANETICDQDDKCWEDKKQNIKWCCCDGDKCNDKEFFDSNSEGAQTRHFSFKLKIDKGAHRPIEANLCLLLGFLMIFV